MSIKHWLPLVALLCLQTPALAAHSGSAPTDPSKPDDEHFMVDTDTGLDTGCTFRGGGPLTFKVKIDRYVGKVKSDGTLENPGVLTQQGVISRSVELKMPAYDIDFSDGEIDEVYFNGHKLGTLQGSDGTWYENQFTVPIEWVKFSAARGENGQKPTAAENEIQIDIDKNNEGWCAAIDWAEMRFKAMAPLLLIHGIGANPHEAWEILPGVTNYLASLGIPFEHNIQIDPNHRIFPTRNRQGQVIEPGNADALEREIRRVAQSFGVQKVHLVGHSKGGLDSRGYLARNYHPDEVRVLSLQTLSSPHHGSVLADASVLARDRDRRLMDGPVVAPEGDEELKNFLYYDFWLVTVRRGPQLLGLADLQTKAMRDFNSDNTFPSDINFYSYGADSDLDGNGDINDAEADPFFPPSFPFVYNRAEAATTAYHLLRDVSTVRLVRDTRLRISFAPIGGGAKEEEVNELVRFATSGQLNDLAVTDNSSKLGNEEHFGSFERNHRNIKDPATMDRVLEKIRRDFPVN